LEKRAYIILISSPLPKTSKKIRGGNNRPLFHPFFCSVLKCNDGDARASPPACTKPPEMGRGDYPTPSKFSVNGQGSSSCSMGGGASY
jgi:hypothetical protein